MGRKCDAEAGRIVRGVVGWCSEKCGTGGGREDLMLKSENIRFQAQY